MNSFNSHGENLKKVVNGIYAGRNSLEQRIEKLRDHGIKSKTPIKKTTPLQDKLMEFEDVKNKIEDDLKNRKWNITPEQGKTAVEQCQARAPWTVKKTCSAEPCTWNT